jgi:hypothetical protein
LTAARGVTIDGVMASARRPWRTWFRLALVVTALGAAVAPARARAGYAEVGAAVTRPAAERHIDAASRALGDGRAQLARRLGFERRVDFERFGGSACVRERLTLAAPVAGIFVRRAPGDGEPARAFDRLYLRYQSLLL